MRKIIHWFKLIYSTIQTHTIQPRHKFKKNKLNISLEDLITHLPGHVYWLDQNNAFLGCNDLQAASAGLKSPQEIIGKTNHDMPWREQAETFDRVNNQVMATAREYTIEETGKLSNGMERTFLSKKVPLFDSESNVVGVLGISFDITEQKEEKKKIIEEKEKTDITLENIISYLPGHVWWLDRNNVFLGCNDLQASAAGLKNRHEIVGKTNYDMPWQEQADSLNKINNEVMATGQEYAVEEPTTLADGTERIFLSKKAPLLDNKKNIIGTLGISLDITKQKEFERKLIEAKNQAEAANIAKTTFLNNMRHDLRTPVTGIIGCAEVIRNNKNNPAKIEEYSNILIKSTQGLLGFLNNVLDSIEIDSGKIPLLNVKFDLESVLRKVVDINAAKAFEKGLKFEFEYDQNTPKYLIGDSRRIYRITLELVTNALKYTKEGGIFISTRFVENSDSQAVIEISIKDTGIGIPADKQQEVFTRFKRLNPSFQGVYNGSGLGLSLVKQFIEDLDAEIHIESELDKGSTFTCVIPVKKPLVQEEFGVAVDPEFINLSKSSQLGLDIQYQSYAGNSSSSLQASNTPFSKRILLVEDHEITAIVAKEILSYANYPVRVDVATDGAMAIHLMNQHKYDIVFMDHGLPDMDGCAATEKIRANSKNKAVPIIGLTAHVSREDKQRCLDAGMNIVLTKPLMKEQIQDILNMFIAECA